MVHWLLWFLVGIFVVASLAHIAYAAGLEQKARTPGWEAFYAVMSAMIAFGILIYGGVL